MTGGPAGGVIPRIGSSGLLGSFASRQAGLDLVRMYAVSTGSPDSGAAPTVAGTVVTFGNLALKVCPSGLASRRFSGNRSAQVGRLVRAGRPGIGFQASPRGEWSITHFIHEIDDPSVDLRLTDPSAQCRDPRGYDEIRFFVIPSFV